MKQLVLLTITLFVSYSSLAEIKKGQKDSALLQELTGIKTGQLNEKQLFASLMTEVENKNLGTSERILSAFLKRYSRSHLTPKALFSVAQLQANKGQLTNSLGTLAKLEKNYPKSSRAVSAHFLKAMIFKKIHLPQQSASVLKDLQKRYPGSPEAFRAQVELKLLSSRIN